MTTDKRPLRLHALSSAGFVCVAALGLLLLAGCVDTGNNYTPPRYREFHDDGTHNRFLREHMYSQQGAPFHRYEHGHN
ncbi:MAG: hypothetical protein ABWY00_16670 [Dongiaceae bacterium]